LGTPRTQAGTRRRRFQLSAGIFFFSARAAGSPYDLLRRAGERLCEDIVDEYGISLDDLIGGAIECGRDVAAVDADTHEMLWGDPPRGQLCGALKRIGCDATFPGPRHVPPAGGSTFEILNAQPLRQGRVGMGHGGPESGACSLK